MLRPNIFFPTTIIQATRNSDGDTTLLPGIPNKQWYIGELIISISGGVFTNLALLELPTGIGVDRVLRFSGDGLRQPFIVLKDIIYPVGAQALATLIGLSVEVLTFRGWAQLRG